MNRTGAVAAALDLGSTRIKAARLAPDGRSLEIHAADAPPLRGEGLIREGDALAYIEVAERLLAELPSAGPELPLGIATQRSSFLLWEAATGRPVTPLVSWQDRRGADWCRAHAALEPEVVRRTGLLLSAHYAGPKLATLCAEQRGLAAGLAAGDLRFGTLDTFLIWRQTDGATHEIDLTVAARTAMADLKARDWSPELLQAYAMPRHALPQLRPTSGRHVALRSGFVVTATIADQAAGALAVLRGERREALVNLGTGAFVLRSGADAAERRRGYLTAPILGDPRGAGRFVLEGAINGAGPALDRAGPGPTAWPTADPAPEAFAIPDLAGLGSPHWCPEIGWTLSPAAERLSPKELRRVVLEGLLFRIREQLEDLETEAPVERIVLAGGLSRDPAVGAGLATLLERPVEVLDESEAVLLGAARLAAGLDPWADFAATRVAPERGAWLVAKYRRWRAWLAGRLAGR